MSRRALVPALLVLAVEAAIAVWLVFTSDHEENPWATVALALTAGVTFVLSGLVALRRRPDNRTGFYLAAVGYLWLLGALGEADDPWVFGLGLLVGGLLFVPFAALVLAYPKGVLETPFDRWFPLATGAILTSISLLLLLFARDPAIECDDCPASPILLSDQPTVADVLTVLLRLAGVALGVLLITVLVRRWHAASAVQRRVLTPVLATGAAAIGFLVAATAAEQFSDGAAGVLSVCFLLAFAAVPVAFLLGILRTRLARSSGAELLVALAEGRPLRDALADALRDPSLELAYWSEGRGAWIDSEGRSAPVPESTADRRATMVERDGRPVAALLHDPALAEEAELVDAVARAAAITLDNERLQAELRAQFALLETIVDTAPSLLTNVGTDGRILNFNKAVEEASGFDDPEELRGRFFWDVFIDPDEREAMIERFRAAAPDFPPGEYENVFVNARGERRVIAWKSAPVADEAGAVRSIVAGGLDITDRHRHAEELERERAFLNAIANNAPSLLCLIDDQGVVQDRATNIAFERLLDYDPEDTGGHIFWERYVAPADVADVRAEIERVLAGGTPREVDNRWVTRSGRRLVVAWSCTPLPRIDERRIFLLSGADVTQRKRQEQELRASRARIVEAEDEARRTLERNLHDGAQQRLVALSLQLRLAEARLADHSVGAATIIARARDELTHALDELRELARGIHPAILTDRGLAAAVDALVARSPVPVEVTHLHERLPAGMEAAAYYVVSEALANVAKYAGASLARVSFARADGRAIVEVADDGVGGADPTRGSGLRGLADRVAAFDGSLEVASPPGGGTVVRAEFPLPGHV